MWCDRIDPARAVIRNLPLPGSGRTWGDVLLHDGAPNGFRTTASGREVPVFDELELLEPSAHLTFELDLSKATTEQRDRLEDVAHDMGAAAEDWSRSLRYLCRRCSEGHPHDDEHDQGLKGERPNLAVVVSAEDEAHLDRVLAAWSAQAAFDGPIARRLIPREG